MHLLNTSTITLSEVKSEKPPAYAILSHQWGDSEVSFQDMQDGKAIQRVTRCCAQAAEDGWQYVWIDSCCIDKKSSAELSEAINSMFQWYRSAQVCYAYLGDVDNTRAFHDSKWFTRGWTLQELLAPETVVFFDRNWIEIGTKSSLAPLISSITGIQHLFSFKKACVAQKMSWAAKRETTRVEDRAYCLMGLFDVNMPLLYGEGEKAFIRLQLEILSSVDDESIFAWAEDVVSEKWWINSWTKPRNIPFLKHTGLLASSPTAFEFSGDVQRAAFDGGRPPYSMTNKGLRIEPLLIQSKLLPSIFLTEDDWPDADDDLYAMQLNCGRIGTSGYLSIYLHQSGAQFTRAGPSILTMFEMRRDPQITDSHNAAFQRNVVFVRQLDQFSDAAQSSRAAMSGIFLIKTSSLLKHGISLSQRFIRAENGSSYWGEDTVDGPQLSFAPYMVYNFCAEMWFTGNDSEAFSVVLKCHSSRFSINLLVPNENQSLKDLEMPFLSSSVVPMSSVDRISKRLRSGKAISVALKKMGDAQRNKYWVDITVDPEGYLRWPEPGQV
jgi:hypothetical protein